MVMIYMELSARNQLNGKVTDVDIGAVMASMLVLKSK